MRKVRREPVAPGHAPASAKSRAAPSAKSEHVRPSERGGAARAGVPVNPVWTEFALQAPPAATSAAQHPPSTADVAVSRAIALSGARLDQSSRDFFGPRFGAD